MKYTEQEQLSEILLRGEKLRCRKDRNVTRGLSTSVAVLFLALAGCIGTLGGKGVLESRTDYGSFLLSAETGGYVLTAVIAFVMGVITTVLIKRYRKSNQKQLE